MVGINEAHMSDFLMAVQFRLLEYRPIILHPTPMPLPSVITTMYVDVYRIYIYIIYNYIYLIHVCPQTVHFSTHFTESTMFLLSLTDVKAQ